MLCSKLALPGVEQAIQRLTAYDWEFDPTESGAFMSEVQQDVAYSLIYGTIHDAWREVEAITPNDKFPDASKFTV